MKYYNEIKLVLYNNGSWRGSWWSDPNCSYHHYLCNSTLKRRVYLEGREEITVVFTSRKPRHENYWTIECVDPDPDWLGYKCNIARLKEYRGQLLDRAEQLLYREYYAGARYIYIELEV